MGPIPEAARKTFARPPCYRTQFDRV